MDLEDWLRRIEQLHPRKWDLGLERVGEVGRRLGVLTPADHVFLVAGTNGKGSTCEAISRLASARGLRVGKTTSPHLVRFNERIVVDDLAVTDEEVCAAFATIDRARKDISLSYFEFAALAALRVFIEREVDVAVLEVGLGGRLDAMNIVDPDISVITRIAMDHESWLGTDRESIAREKAGIMRADRFCVIADESPPQSLTVATVETGARPVRITRDFGVDDDGLFIRTDTGERRFHRPGPPQLPEQSLLAAIQAVSLAGFTPSAADVHALYSDLRLPGRFQQLPAPRRTLLDVAHNPDAAVWLADRLAACKSGECHAVVGVYADKDYNAMLRSLVPLVDRWYPSDLDDPRAVAAADLADCLVACGGSVAGTYGKVSAAYDDALNNSAATDLILVFGSFLTVGGVLDYLHVPV